MSGATNTGTMAARLEWWRRSSFTLIGVLIMVLAGFTAYYADSVDDRLATDREDIEAIEALLAELPRIADALEAVEAAQQQNALLLSGLSSKIDTLETLHATR